MTERAFLDFWAGSGNGTPAPAVDFSGSGGYIPPPHVAVAPGGPRFPMTPREAYIVLNRIEGIGPRRLRSLCDALGSPENVLAADYPALLAADGIGEKVASAIVAARGTIDPAEEEERAAALGARIVTPLDPGYPEPLRTIHDPPLCLYVRGTLLPEDARAIAIVGTRQATHYGISQADRFAYQLAKTGFAVVSGLARGIDTAAHRGALKAGGRTLAVLGGALDRFYPPENRALGDEIAANGAVLSEFPLGLSPNRVTFPYRNRIVSGLSKAVFVVEAGLNSGAMQTAALALEQDRALMALPGRIDTDGSRGPNRLIQQGARLVQDIRDILEEFEFLFPPSAAADAERTLDPRASAPLPPDEAAILRALWQTPERPIDEVIRETGLPASRVTVLAMQMEMKRLVKMLPGRRLALAADIGKLVPPPPATP